MPSFARHESFHPRYGWLKKSYDFIKGDPALFQKQNAHITLGVGKNMARSMKQWMLAFKLCEEAEKEKGLCSTNFGDILFSDAGLDPYIERTASLWLLHWQLLKKPCSFTFWDYVFNQYNRQIIDLTYLLIEIKAFLSQNYPKLKVAESSIKSDMSCLIRMYAGNEAKSFSEDFIDSPFSKLILIESEDKYSFQFSYKNKMSLPEEILTACCFDYISIYGADTKSFALEELSYAPGSPGRIFKVPLIFIEQAFDSLQQKDYPLALSNTAGVLNISFREKPQRLALSLVKDCYN